MENVRPDGYDAYIYPLWRLASKRTKSVDPKRKYRSRLIRLSGLEKIYYQLVRNIFGLLCYMPETWTVIAGNLIGRIWFGLDKRHRNVTLSNLKQAFGDGKSDSENKRLAIQVFQNIAKIPFEVAWSMRLNQKNYLRYFRIRGLHNLQSAFEKGKGVLLLTAHFGNWELLPSVIQLAGYPLNIIYRPLSFKPMDRYLYDYRERFGVKLIPKKKSMRQILQALGRKEAVGIVLDQDSGLTAGVFTDFFGKKASTSKGLSLVALKTEVPVLPGFITRVNDQYHVELGTEIPLIKTGNKEYDIAANTQQYNQAIEAAVRKNPDQWFWVHNRWKNKRPSEKF